MSSSATESFNYSHDGHEVNILKQFNRQRDNEELCDVTLVVGAKRFIGHRALLSAASPYFHAMFTGGMLETQKESVDIKGIAANIFKLLLDFIYSGQITITDTICQDVMAAAGMLQLPGAINACCTFLTQQLHPSNAIGIYQFAQLQGCEHLRHTSERYIYAHFSQVTQEDEFSDVTIDTLVYLLRSEHLQVENEYHVFTIAMKWILHDPPKRRQHVFKALETIRFPIISPNQIEHYTEECPDFSLKIALQKTVADFQQIRSSYDARSRPYLFTPRRCARKCVYVLGGYNREEGGNWSDSHSLATAECFDTFNQQWQTLPSMQHARSGHGVCAHQGLVYAIGGENDSLIFHDVERYDPQLNRWEPVCPMTEPRCGLGCVVVDDEIYAIGGWVGSTIGNTMEKYCPNTDKWTKVDDLQTLRFSMGLAEYDGEIYVIGGMSDQATELKTVEKYDPVYKEWKRLADMIEPRAYVGVAVIEPYIYAVGGWNEDTGSLNTVERYHIKKNMWESVPPMREERASASVACVNDLLYVMGGRRSYHNRTIAPTTRDTVEIFDPQRETWSESDHRMPTGRCETGVAVL